MEGCCWLQVVPPNQSTMSRMLWTQHATVTAYSSLGGTYHGYCYWLARINGIRLHQDPGNRQPFDQYGDLLPLQKRHWLPRTSTNVFRTHDLQTWYTRQCHHQWRQRVYESILRQNLLPSQYQLPILNRIPPADRWLNWTVELNNGTIPPSIPQLRAGQLGPIVTTGRICVNQLRPPFHTDDTS